MTLARKLAVTVAQDLVRWAAPGCKDWAEGLEREIEFIESDWRALAWAIGSTRILLDRRRVRSGPEGSPRRPGTVEWCQWSLYAFVSFIASASLTTATASHERVGFWLILVGCVHKVASSILDWRWDRWEPSMRDLIAYRIFLRDGLRRKLKEYRLARRCFRFLTDTALLMGFQLTGWIVLWPTSPYSMVGIAAVGLAFLRWGDSPAKIQERIERMNVLIEQAKRPAAPPRRVHSEHWGHAESGSTIARHSAGNEE